MVLSSSPAILALVCEAEKEKKKNSKERYSMIIGRQIEWLQAHEWHEELP